MKTLPFTNRILMTLLMVSGISMMNTDAFGQVVSDINDGCFSPADAGTTSCSVAIGSGSLVTVDGGIAIGANSSVSTNGTAIAIGSGASASGSSAIVVGASASATGTYSYVLGHDSEASGTHSTAIGTHCRAFSEESLALGHYVDAWNTTSRNFVIGLGIDGSTQLRNDEGYSMMLGMNSNVSTVFIGNSGGTSGSWGNVGIGDITDPGSLLHVRDTMRLGLTGSAAGSLVFNNSAGNTITVNTPASMSDQTYTLPTASGSTNDFLQLGASGQLQWASAGSVTGAWLLTGNGGTSATTNFLGTTDNVDLVFRTNGNEEMRILAGGNVGIGTSAPVGTLHLDDNDSDTELIIERSGSTEANLRFNVGSNQRARIGLESSDVDLYYDHLLTGRDHIFRIVNGDYGSDYEVVRIEGSTANVGVGESSPGAKLHVMAEPDESGAAIMGRFGIQGIGAPMFLQIANQEFSSSLFAPIVQGTTNGTTSPGFMFRGMLEDDGIDTGTQPIVEFQARKNSSDSSNVRVRVRPLFQFTNNDVELVTITSANSGNTGRTGIGTTTPSGTLDVNGTVFINPSAATVPPSTVIGGGGNEQDLGINSANGQLINLSTSSIHYKENVEDIEFDHEAFLNLRAVDFQWKQYFGGGDDVGMIAQEVAQTFPALASWSHKYTHLPDGSLLMDTLGVPVVDTTQLEVSGVRYHKLPVYLFSIVKEQQSRVQQLEQQVQELTDRLDGCCADVEPMNRMDGGGDPGNGSFSEFVLLRNDPNPFSDYTDVQYEHDGCTDCQIIITDVSGRIIKRIRTEGTKGTVRVYSSEIGSGMFIYSLVKDGKTVSSERMISSNR